MPERWYLWIQAAPRRSLFPFLNCALSVVCTSSTGAFSRHHFCRGDSTTRSTIATAVFLLRHPRILTLASRTSVETLSIGFVWPEAPPSLVRVAVRRQQTHPILGEARYGLQNLLNEYGLPLDKSSATFSGSTGDAFSQAQSFNSPGKRSSTA